MSKSTIAKLSVVVLLGMLSSALTSSLLAQSRAKKVRNGSRNSLRGAQLLEVAGAPTTSVTRKPARPDASSLSRPSATRIPANSIEVSHFKLKYVKVRAVGSEVQAEAAVSIMDTRPGMSYLWSISVRDPATKAVLSRFDYTNQMFRYSGSPMDPTFSERFQLPPGRYVVVVELYNVPPNFDLATLKESSVSKAMLKLSGVAHVTVAD